MCIPQKLRHLLYHMSMEHDATCVPTFRADKFGEYYNQKPCRYCKFIALARLEIRPFPDRRRRDEESTGNNLPFFQ